MLETADTRRKQQKTPSSACGHVDVLSYGCSGLAAAILAGFEKKTQDARIVAVDPQIETVRDSLPGRSRIRLLCRSDRARSLQPRILFLGGKAGLVEDPSPALLDLARNAIVVSIIPTLPLSFLKEALGTRKVARVTPNLPVMVGEGMSLGHCSENSLSQSEQRAVADLLASVGQFTWLANESHFDLASAVTGDGPGFVFSLAEQMIMTLYTEGMPLSLAETLVRQTLFGASAMLCQDDRSPRALKQDASGSGASREGLAILEHHDALPRLIPAAISEAHQRLRHTVRHMEPCASASIRSETLASFVNH